MLSYAARHLCSSAGGGKGVNYQGAAGLGVCNWGWGAVDFFLGCPARLDGLTLVCGTVKDLPAGAVSCLCLILAMCTLGLPSLFLSSPASPSICSTQGFLCLG